MARGFGRGRRRRIQYLNDDVPYIDYKTVELLDHFILDRGKIQPRRNNCAARSSRAAPTATAPRCSAC